MFAPGPARHLVLEVLNRFVRRARACSSPKRARSSILPDRSESPLPEQTRPSTYVPVLLLGLQLTVHALPSAVRLFGGNPVAWCWRWGVASVQGAGLGFFPIDDHAAVLREDIETLSGMPYLSPIKVIAGFVYDVESGEIDDIVRWERPASEAAHAPAQPHRD